MMKYLQKLGIQPAAPGGISPAALRPLTPTGVSLGRTLQGTCSLHRH